MKHFKAILTVGLIAGTLDAAAAVVLYAKPVNLHTVAGIFRYIASALFGRHAFSGGLVYVIMGLIMHYLISFFWSSIYLKILSPIFKPGFVWLKMILFSSTIWIMMNGFALPLCGLTSAHHDAWTILTSYAPILLCVAFPICIIFEKYQYSNQKSDG